MNVLLVNFGAIHEEELKKSTVIKEVEGKKSE
jgi:hypothetical protein